MVKIVLSSWTVAIASGDDSAGLVQLSTKAQHSQHSQGQRILAAVAKEGNTICVEAVAGDVAPVPGSYTAKMSQQAVEVAAGSIAPQAGSFCVPKQDVLLMQRTFGLHTARDFEAALGKKKEKQTTTTTTIMDFENHNFAEEDWNKVMVPQCDAQSIEAAVIPKNPWDAYTGNCGSACAQEMENRRAEERKRVCECRSFLQSSAAKIGPKSLEDIQKLLARNASASTQLLQRNFDAALSKKQPTSTTTSTTTTNSDERMIEGCRTASQLPVEDLGAYGIDDPGVSSWATVAKLLNDPAVGGVLFAAAGITEGWQHCSQSWVVRGACGKYLVPTETNNTVATPAAA